MDDLVFDIGPESPVESLTTPMSVPPGAALIEAEVNSLLQQIYAIELQIQQRNANCARHSSDYHLLISSDPSRAQAASAAYQQEDAARQALESSLPALRLRLAILNHFHIAR